MPGFGGWFNIWERPTALMSVLKHERTGQHMARNGDSLAYTMKAQAIGTKTRHQDQAISDRDTIRGYKNNIDRFCNWAKESGLTKEQVLASPKEHLQAYTNHLVQEGYSKSTVHTYIAAPCKGLDVPMQHISCLLYTSPSPRDYAASRMPSSA